MKLSKITLIILWGSLLTTSLLAGCNSNKENVQVKNIDVSKMEQQAKQKVEIVEKKIDVNKLREKIQTINNPTQDLVNSIKNICNQWNKQACQTIIENVKKNKKLPDTVIKTLENKYLK